MWDRSKMHHSKGWGGSQLLPEVKIQSHNHEIAAWEGLGGGILQEFPGCGHKSEWREQNKIGQIQELAALVSPTLMDSQLKDNWFTIKSCLLMNPKHRAILRPAHSPELPFYSSQTFSLHLAKGISGQISQFKAIPLWWGQEPRSNPWAAPNPDFTNLWRNLVSFGIKIAQGITRARAAGDKQEKKRI